MYLNKEVLIEMKRVGLEERGMDRNKEGWIGIKRD